MSVRLRIEGACEKCPFMDLEIISEYMYTGSKKVGELFDVICKHESYCDREEMQKKMRELEQEAEEARMGDEW